jgi:predicted transcriptional regulator with HTH domain
MSLSETVEALEELYKLGLVQKRVKNGIVQWKITDKGKQTTKKTLKTLLSSTDSKQERFD